MEKKFQYILFDLDGTLTDPKEGICKSVQFALHQMGIEEPDIDRLEPFIGPPLLDSFMDFYHMTKQEAEKAIEHYRERFSAIGLYENAVYNGVPKMLQHLKQSGSYLAVASSKPEIFVKRILKHFHLEDYFDVIVGSELDGRSTIDILDFTTEFRPAYITADFTDEVVEEVTKYVCDTINEIESLDDDIESYKKGLNPNKDFFCKTLCGFRDRCLNK